MRQVRSHCKAAWPCKRQVIGNLDCQANLHKQADQLW